MLKVLKLQSYIFLRTPLWLLLFLAILVVSLIMPAENLTSLEILPGMVYFIMAASLLLMIFGAETARMEKANYQTESLFILPKYRIHLLGKIIFWLLLSFLFYLLFYLEVIVYIGLMHGNITYESFLASLLYTLLCWFIPFFLSIVIGYLCYSAIPSIVTYVGIVLIWFLIMPYNSLTGFFAIPVSGWLVAGDPNIEQIHGTYRLEMLQLNYGFYIQRIAMLLLILSIFFAMQLKGKKVRMVCTGGVLVALCIPLISPYVPYITESENIRSFIIDEDLKHKDKFNISEYNFIISHGRSNHELSYMVDIHLEAEEKEISLALLNAFTIIEARWNDESISFTHNQNLLDIQLPNNKGVLKLQVKTNSFVSVAPTFFELISTIPWYPMHPREATDPYHHALKEKYSIAIENMSPNQIYSNLPIIDNKFVGEAYGPVLLLGDFERIGAIIAPKFKKKEQIAVHAERTQKIIEGINEKLAVSSKLPEKLYAVSTVNRFTSNPEEAFLYYDERIDQSQNILESLYLKKFNGFQDVRLFLKLYNKQLEDASMIDMHKRQFGEMFIDLFLEVYPKMEEHEKLKLLRQWYNETSGMLTTERILEEL